MSSFKLSKKFCCPYHNTRYIDRVYRDSTASKILYCIDCLKKQPQLDPRRLIKLDDIIHLLSNKNKDAGLIKLIGNEPRDLNELVDMKDEALYKFSEYIHKEKHKVNSHIDTL